MFENIVKKLDGKNKQKQNAEVELETSEEVILKSSDSDVSDSHDDEKKQILRNFPNRV